MDHRQLAQWREKNHRDLCASIHPDWHRGRGMYVEASVMWYHFTSFSKCPNREHRRPTQFIEDGIMLVQWVFKKNYPRVIIVGSLRQWALAKVSNYPSQSAGRSGSVVA